MHRFEEPTVVSAFAATARAHGPEHLNHSVPVLVRHPRQHGRPPQTDPPGSRKLGCGKSASQVAGLNPSTRPRLAPDRPEVNVCQVNTSAGTAVMGPKPCSH